MQGREKNREAAISGENQAGVIAQFYQVNNLTRRTQLATQMEVAGTGSARSKGLLGRKCLEPGQALWIVPCEAVHTFWMQFAIDLVYIDKKHQVRKVRSAVPAWRISGCFSAHSVIELPAGVVRQTETQPGDILEFVLSSAQCDVLKPDSRN